MSAAPTETCPAADTAVCMCGDCTHTRRVSRLRELSAAALRCGPDHVDVAVYRRTNGRWRASVTVGDLVVTYGADAPGDAAQGVLAALTGTLDLSAGGAS